MIVNVEFPTMNPKGLIKVELFEEGKQVQEVNTHNFISKGVRDYFFKMAMKSLFHQNRKSGGRKSYDDLNDLFKCIHLTTATHPEEPENEWLIKGKEVGYALSDIIYSGSDILQGTYNAAESFTVFNKVKMVFDFPTHCANGMFRSIYFSSRGSALLSSMSSSSYLFKNIPIPYGNNLGSLSIKFYKGKLYRLRSDRVTLDIFDSQYNLLETITLPYTNNYDFEIVNDNIYFVNNLSARAVYKMSINDFSTNEILVTGYTNAGGICYDEINNQFVVARSSGASSSGVITIRRYNSVFEEVSSVDIINYSIGSTAIRLYYIEGDILLNNRALINNNSVIEFDITGHNMISGIVNDGIAVQSSFSYPVYIIPKAQIGSRCLLDTPITKNPNQTMKITYDFILE